MYSNFGCRRYFTNSGVADWNTPVPEAAKMDSCWDALQTTFSDKNRMRRSAAGRVRAGGNQCGGVPAVLNSNQKTQWVWGGLPS